MGRRFVGCKDLLRRLAGRLKKPGGRMTGGQFADPLRDIQVLFRFELLFNHSFNLMNAFRIRREPIRR